MKVILILSAALVAAVVIFLALTRKAGPQVVRTQAPSDTFFVFIRIPESLQPIDRGTKFEDPLNAGLQAGGYGEVTGGGSQLSEPRSDGTRGIEWVGVDVELVDLDRGLPFLKAELIRLGAPKGTVLEYNRFDESVEDPVH